MNCSKCGNELKEGAKFCTKCGSKIKLSRLFISSVILIAVGVIGGIQSFFLFCPYRWEWERRDPFPVLTILTVLTLVSGITLALISLYKNKHKMTMIVGITASALNLLMRMIPRIRNIRIRFRSMGVIEAVDADGYRIVIPVADRIISQLRMQNIRDIILSGAIILAFILLYKKKHKIILIAGLAVIALFLVLNLVSVFRVFGW